MSKKGSWLCFLGSLGGMACLQANYSAAQEASSKITPIAGPVSKKWAEFTIAADFIYWQVREDYLHFAMDGSIGAISKEGQIYDFDFEYSPGLKVALGLDFKHDGWDLTLGYTWVQENNVWARAEHVVEQGPLEDVSLYQFTGRPSDNSVEAYWNLHFNAIDWDLGRRFYVSRFLALRPFMGIKGAWINQKFNCLGRATVYTTDDAFNNVVQSQEFWGVGLRGGLNLDFHFTRNWSFYGMVAVDTLYGQYQDTSLTIQLDPAILDVARRKQWQRCYLHSISPVLELGLGLRYETFFAEDRYQLFAQAGWEQQVWFDQNRFIVGLASGSGQISGNLVLQGLDLRLGFSF